MTAFLNICFYFIPGGFRVFFLCLFIFSVPSQTHERKNKMQEKASSPKNNIVNMTRWSLKGWETLKYVNGKQNMHFLLQDVMPGMFQMTVFDKKKLAKLLSLHQSHHTVGETRLDKNKHVLSLNVSNQVTKIFFCHGSGVQTPWCVLLFAQAAAGLTSSCRASPWAAGFGKQGKQWGHLRIASFATFQSNTCIWLII